jgi:TonB family protein
MRVSRRAAAVLIAAAFFTTDAARGQDTPASAAAPAPPVTPPTVQGSTDVPYPKGANGDAVVVLEVTIEKDGTVSSAVVMEGASPFAEQARQAVVGWRFTPALRESRPVVARIRARVEFHQMGRPNVPPSATSPTAQAPASTTLLGSAQAAAPELPEEVNVRGIRGEIGQTTLSATDAREMPGAFGDPFRAIEALPGVVPLQSGVPYFYIRGAPPNDNGYYIDGIRVPLLFHVGIGEGVIHPALIDHVDFYPGAAPASYGGFAGGTIAGQTREPATRWHGEANLRVIDAGALVEAPIDDGRFTVLAAGRYGYPGPILGAITSSVSLNYWDYQTRATWRITDQDVLGVFAFGSHDYLATQSSGSAVMTNGAMSNISSSTSLREELVSDFHRLDLRWDHSFANGDGHTRVGATVGYDLQGADPTYATDYSMATRFEIEGRLSPTFRVRGGADARYDDYGFKQGAAAPGPDDNPSTANPPPTNVTWGAHADVVWRLLPRVEIVPGVRFDVFQSTRATAPRATTQVSTIVPAFDPRLSARVTLTDSVAWLSAFGLSHQYPTLRVGSVPPPVVSVPGFPFGVSQVQTVAQASQGVELALPADFTATLTGFLSGWWGLTDLTANCLHPPDGPPQCPDDQPVHGEAYGLELLLRRPLSRRLTGWLSYTLSRSTREAHYLTSSGNEATTTIVGDYDRTHVLNVMGAYDLGSRWRLGARVVFYTGTPYSDNYLPGQGSPVPPLNDRLYPPFYRVDLRVEKRWPLGNERSIAFVAEVQNVTLSKEARSYECSARQIGSAPLSMTCSVRELGPITLPSVGVEAFF